MVDTTKAGIGTKVVHAGQAPEPITGAVMPPIFTSSTYAQPSPGQHSGFEYSRSHNPTRYALERMVARLEGSTLSEEQDASFGGFAFSSGLAAIATALELLDAGAHVISMDDVYGGTNRQFQQVRRRTQNIAFDFVDMTDIEAVKRAIKPHTGMVWIETPTNPTLKVVDIRAVRDAVKSVAPECIVVVDGTFTSPVNQRPLEHGADIVMHSVTKYLNGHSDVVGGVLATGDAGLAQRLRFLQNAVGSVMGPFDAYLTLRGIKTLAVRIRQHNRSAHAIAQHLLEHDQVERVVYPGLPSHPQHSVHAKQVAEGGGGGGMITFFIKGGLDEARAFLEAVEVFTLAESLGGVESLIEHPAIMTHASVPPDMRKTLGISDTLIRLSVGVEDTDDLIADLERGFAAAAKAGSGAVATSG